MASHSNGYGIIATIAGIAAISLTGVFFYLNGGFVPVGPPLDDHIADRELFITYIVLAHLFQLGTPLLCTAAFLFGFAGKSSWAARIGIALATASLLMYVLTIRACFQLFL